MRFRGGCLGLGTAGMIVMNEHTDMVQALRNCVRFYAHESCGQCTPCREGSAWMRKILDRIVDGQGRAKDLDMLLELEKTQGIMPGTTICGLADGTAWATRTFINKYYDEFAARCIQEPVVPVTIKRGTTECAGADGEQYAVRYLSMNIVSVHIRNYRAIEDLVLSFTDAAGAIRPVNVIVGPNGSGKTSALFAITQSLRGVLGFRTMDVPPASRDDIRGPVGGSAGWSESPPEAMVDVTLEFDQAEQDAVIRLAPKIGLAPPPKLSNGRLTVHWKHPPAFDKNGQRYDWWNSSVEPYLENVRSWLHAKRQAIRALNQRLISFEEASAIGGFEFFPQDRNLLRRVIGVRPTEDSLRSDVDEEELEEGELLQSRTARSLDCRYS